MRTRAQAIPDRVRRAFTLVETMIVMGIIALLAGILLVAIAHVKKSGDVVAEQGAVSALQKGVEQFKQQFGFLPPLVVDYLPAPSGVAAVPTYNIGAADLGIAVWPAAELANYGPTLNTQWPTGTLSQAEIDVGRSRCSELSLVYYIAGALDAPADGIDGLGFTAPNSNRDGNFSRKGRKYDPFVDPAQWKTKSGTIRLMVPTGSTSGSAQSRAKSRERVVILDRWSDTAVSHPIRYYRWLPSYYPVGTPRAGQVQYWNVPVAVGGAFDPVSGVAILTNPPTKSELKSAEYAIVSPGPDGLFGDEPGLTGPQRKQAISDNIVEVGK